MALKRPIPAFALVISTIAFVATSALLANKIVSFNRDKLPARAHFMPIEAEQFRFGSREVHFTEDTTPTGKKVVVVSFGDDTIRLTETIPGGVEELPDLRRYEDWLRVYRFIIVKGMSAEDAVKAIETDEVDDRLAIVVRNPPPGADHRTWGEVWSHGWTFDIYELTEAGDIVHERLAYPSKRRGNEPPKEGELVEGTWQYDAAMTSIPPVARPKPQFDNDASLQFGLDFFLAGVFGMVMILSAGFLFAPPKRTE
jgi:hypothetical protein